MVPATTSRPPRPSSTTPRAAREAAAAHHEEQSGGLIDHVERSLERFRAGELSAFEVDELIFQYSRAAQELWKFCNLGSIEIVARIVQDESPGDWWERGARWRR